MRDDVGTDHAVGARAVVDDKRLTEAFAEFLRDYARRQVVGAARRERHDNAHRFEWKFRGRDRQAARGY